MKVTKIEVHEISLPYLDWLAYPLNHYGGPTRRTIYVAHTDTGLVGLGDGGRPVPEDVLDRYIDTNPFDWMGDELSLPLGMAMYDLMGQAAGVPVYKLFGQKHRSWVPVGSWTVSTHPDHMADAVQRYAAMGYTWMKYHLSPFENVFDQTAAMQAVAPPGFRVHYDFTGGGTDDHMVDLLTRLQEYPIVGCFEDAINEKDIAGSIELRKHIRLPIVRHRAALDCTYEVLMGAGDAYIRGHQLIGPVTRQAGLFAAGNIPFMLQSVGTTIARAMTTHMMAAFPSASFHFHSDTETWSDDVVHERLEPVNGFVRVPEKPGLGLSLDREALERLTALELAPQPRWIIASTYANGTQMYCPYEPGTSGHFMVRPDWKRGLVPFSYCAPITTRYWDDDGGAEFAQMYDRLEREGMVLEPPSGWDGQRGGPHQAAD
jgi:gluconate/galactonate dehydratase